MYDNRMPITLMLHTQVLFDAVCETPSAEGEKSLEVRLSGCCLLLLLVSLMIFSAPPLILLRTADITIIITDP